MCRAAGLFVAGIIIGIVTTLGAIFATGGLYEYRPPPFDIQQLARDRCEPISGPATILYFRCPRFATR